MQNLFQLGVRDAELAPPDRRHGPDGGVVEGIAQGATANHSRPAHDDKT